MADPGRWKLEAEPDSFGLRRSAACGHAGGSHAKIRILSESVFCRRNNSWRSTEEKPAVPAVRARRVCGESEESSTWLWSCRKKRFSGGGFGFRGGLQIFDTAMSCPVGRGCHAVLFAEEFDEVRGVGKGACGADFGDRLVGRDQKQPGMDQALPDEPLVGRGPVDAEKFLFERSQGAVAAFCDLLDRNIGKDDLLVKTGAETPQKQENATL